MRKSNSSRISNYEKKQNENSLATPNIYHLTLCHLSSASFYFSRVISLNSMTKRTTILLLILIVAAFSVNGQADYGNKTDALQLCKAVQGNQFSNYKETNTAIEEILSVIGAKNRFVVQPCDNINNAVAVTLQGIRYIFFDPDFMNSISSGSYSSNLFILAHEVGHHINGHSQDIIMLLSEYAPTGTTLAEERTEELEADEFAGFVLAKLGYGLASMQTTLRSIADDSDDSYSTHPSLSKRLSAVEAGFNKAKGNQPLKTNVSSTTQTAEEYFYSAFDKGNNENNKGAIDDWSKAVELDPNMSEAYFNRGIAKGRLADHLGQMADYNKAIELDPNMTHAYYNRGISKAQQNDNKGAIEDFDKVIEIGPDVLEAYVNRGIAKGLLNDLNGEISDYNKAIELDPNNAKAYYNRGNAKAKLENHQGAISDFSKAIELEPRNAAAWCGRGMAKAQLGGFREAVADYNMAIEFERKMAEAYFFRGFAKAQLQDFRGAMVDLNEALELNPNDSEAFYYRGLTKTSLEDYRGAIVDCNKAIVLNSKYSNAYYLRGVAKLSIGDKDSGCVDLSKAGELGHGEAYDLIKRYCQ